MKNKKFDYKVIEQDRLAELLEFKLIVDKLGVNSTVSNYETIKKSIRLLGYVQNELDNYDNLSDVIEEVLDAENVSEVSDEEKEDSLYIEEFDSCDCGCCSDDYDDEEEDDEVEGIYVVVHLEEEEDDEDTDWEGVLDCESDTDWADEFDTVWADEFDDFYSDSLENSIFKEMEDFVNGKYVSSAEQEQEKAKDKVIISPELYHILKGYFKNIFE